MSLLELIPGEGEASKPEPKPTPGKGEGQAHVQEGASRKGQSQRGRRSAPRKPHPRRRRQGGVKKGVSGRSAKPSGATTRRAPRGPARAAASRRPASSIHRHSTPRFDSGNAGGGNTTPWVRQRLTCLGSGVPSRCRLCPWPSVCLAGLRWSLRWFSRRGAGRSEGQVRILARCPLEPRRAVYLLQVAGRCFLVGVGDGSHVVAG